MFTTGRVIGIGFALFALACLIATYDFSKGRTPETDSPLVAEVLAASKSRDCGRDVTEIVQKYVPLGTEQAVAEQALAGLEIERPRPWFWIPRIENSTAWSGSTLEALRTIKATAFGNELLRMYLGFQDGKLHRLAAEVVCRFD